MREASMIEMNTTPYTHSAGSSGTAPRPRTIVGVISADQTLTAEGLIWLVASAGQTSDDPLVQGIVAYAHGHQMRLALPNAIQDVAAGGLEAVVDGRTVLLGTRLELQHAGMSLEPVATQAQLLDAAGLAVIYAAVDSGLAGGIVLGVDGYEDIDVVPADADGGSQ
jgi:cation transport ATPase